MNESPPWSPEDLPARLQGPGSDEWRPRRYVVVRVWRSFQPNVFVHLSAGPGAPHDLLFKLPQGAEPEIGRRMYEEMARLAGAPEIGAARLQIPSPVGWTTEPPGYCCAYVEGVDLSGYLSDRETDVEDILRVVEDSARGLGAYHAVSPVSEPLEADRERAARDLQRIARRLAVRVDADVVTPDSMARFHSDYTPANLRRDGHGRLWLLDPPVGNEVDVVHRDVGILLSRFRLRTRSKPIARDELTDTLLAGYSQGGGRALHGPSDRRALAVYEVHASLRTFRTHLRERRFDRARRVLTTTVASRAAIARS